MHWLVFYSFDKHHDCQDWVGEVPPGGSGLRCASKRSHHAIHRSNARGLLGGRKQKAFSEWAQTRQGEGKWGDQTDQPGDWKIKRGSWCTETFQRLGTHNIQEYPQLQWKCTEPGRGVEGSANVCCWCWASEGMMWECWFITMTQSKLRRK